MLKCCNDSRNSTRCNDIIGASCSTQGLHLSFSAGTKLFTGLLPSFRSLDCLLACRWLTSCCLCTGSPFCAYIGRDQGLMNLFLKGTNPIVGAPPSWSHLTLIISLKPISKCHHVKGKSFNKWILRRYKHYLQHHHSRESSDWSDGEVPIINWSLFSWMGSL